MSMRLLKILLASTVVFVVGMGCSGTATKKNAPGSAVSVDPFDYGDEFSQIANEKKLTVPALRPNSEPEEPRTGVQLPDSDVSIDFEGAAPTDGNTDQAQGIILGYRIQIGAFENKENAETMALRARNRLDYQVYITYQPPFYRVRVGDFTDKNLAERAVRTIREKGFREARWVPTQITTQR